MYKKNVLPSLDIVGIYLKICFIFYWICVCACACSRHQTCQEVIVGCQSSNRSVGNQGVILLESSKCKYDPSP